MFALIYIILALAALFFLIGKSATLLVKNLSHIAKYYNLNDFILGFVILGFFTSTPELFIGIDSSLKGVPQLSVGNLLGGAIILLSLIIGIVAVINKGVSIKKSFHLKDMLLITLYICFPALLILDARISRLDGFMLVAFYFLIIYWLWKTESNVKVYMENSRINLKKDLAFSIIGLGGVMICAYFIVDISNKLAAILKMPYILLGILILAFGTNLPELTIAIKSKHFRHEGLSLGNILGSAFANTFILGIISLIKPIELPRVIPALITILFLYWLLVLFTHSAETGRRISFKEGLMHLGVYAVFILLQLAINF
ncbi:sodium:calcium antiporter [Candidatus Parcubacteria bacterium]|nr:MAG: sodium:calcium antiporter [Candidatus Parcubacteria bacterium]